MSLTSFLSLPDVTAKVKSFRPKPPRKIPAQLKVEPRSNRFSMVGTAFDYFLRFELQRRAPHAISKDWIAEHGAWTIEGMGDEETAERAFGVVETAKTALAAFVTNESPTRSEQSELAGHAIRLAKLDVVFRAPEQGVAPSFGEAAQEDIEDLLDMLAIVPFNSLLHESLLILNPTFGKSSVLVGGADSDLITGDLLVDFKTTKESEMQVKALDQLFGYFLLARNHRRADPKFPEIKQVALYFCRHGHLWPLDVSAWTNMPQFPEVEQWFLKRAVEVFGMSRQRAPTRSDSAVSLHPGSTSA